MKVELLPDANDLEVLISSLMKKYSLTRYHNKSDIVYGSGRGHKIVWLLDTKIFIIYRTQNV